PLFSTLSLHDALPISLARLRLDGEDLLGEASFADRRRRALVTLQGECVLFLARDSPLPCDVLGGDPHVDLLERVVQRAEHHVEQDRKSTRLNSSHVKS